MPRAGLPTRDQIEEQYQAGIKARNEKIAELRQRSGLSMDDLAKAMGFAGQSSIQRYLSPSYDMGFRPELAAKFRTALIGRGVPPISEADLKVFSGGNLIQPGDDGYEKGDYETNFVRALASIDRQAFREGILTAVLPLVEGEVRIELPSDLSNSSAEAVRVWLEHLVSLAQDLEGQQARLAQRK